jgi:hypothetical protein
MTASGPAVVIRGTGSSSCNATASKAVLRSWAGCALPRRAWRHTQPATSRPSSTSSRPVTRPARWLPGSRRRAVRRPHTETAPTDSRQLASVTASVGLTPSSGRTARHREGHHMTTTKRAIVIAGPILPELARGLYDCAQAAGTNA